MKKLFSLTIIIILLTTVISPFTFSQSYSTELTEAYNYAYKIGVTTQPSINTANMYGILTRIALAKMVSNYVLQLGLQTPDTSMKCNFTDISDTLDNQYSNGVTNACQLGLMGVGISTFRPYDEVTRAEFGTVLSRALWGDTNNGGKPYYIDHLNALNTSTNPIMVDISQPNMTEKRGYVMLMMQRADKKETLISNNIEKDSSNEKDIFLSNIENDSDRKISNIAIENNDDDIIYSTSIPRDPKSCIDSDGVDFYNGGYVTTTAFDRSAGIDKTYRTNDYCVLKGDNTNENIVDSCSGDDCFVVEAACNYIGEGVFGSMGNFHRRCQYGCEEGACVYKNNGYEKYYPGKQWEGRSIIHVKENWRTDCIGFTCINGNKYTSLKWSPTYKSDEGSFILYKGIGIGNNYGYVDKYLNIIIPTIYKKLSLLDNRLFYFEKEDFHKGILKENGNVFFEGKFKVFNPILQLGVIIVSKNFDEPVSRPQKVIDTSGKYIIDGDYHEVKLLPKNNKIKIDRSGNHYYPAYSISLGNDLKQRYETIEKDMFLRSAEKYIRIESVGALQPFYDIMDFNGNIIIPANSECRLEQIYTSDGDLKYFICDRGYNYDRYKGVYDIKGKVVIPIEYDKIEIINADQGTFKVIKNNQEEIVTIN